MTALVAVSSTTARLVSSYTCAAPVGTAAGQVLVAFQSADVPDGSAEMTTPTGGTTWSLLHSATALWGVSKAWWKVAGGSEPANYTFTQNSSADAVVAIAALADAVVSTPLVAATNPAGSFTAVPTPTLAPDGSAVELRWATGTGSGSARTWSVPAGYTSRVSTQSTTYTTAALATKSVPAGPTGVLNFGCSDSLQDPLGFSVAVVSPIPRTQALFTSAAIHRAAYI